PVSQRARISRTCSGVSLERRGGRYLTGCDVRARWRFARARRTSWYASTRAMTSRLVCAVRHAWSRRSWALARRRSMSRIGTEHLLHTILTGPVSEHRREVRHIRRLRPRIGPDTGPDRRQQLGDFLIEPQRQVLGMHPRAAPMQLVAVRLHLHLHLS